MCLTVWTRIYFHCWIKYIRLKQIYDAQCPHLFSNDIHALFYHNKVPAKRCNETTIFNLISFHGSCNILSVLETLFRLKIRNWSNRHHLESTVHKDSIIKVEILVACFVLFHCALAYFGSSSCYIDKGKFHSNKSSFFQLLQRLTCSQWNYICFHQTKFHVLYQVSEVTY